MKKEIKNVGLVGAAGLVGKHLMACIEKLELPISKIVPFGRSSVGEIIETPFGHEQILPTSNLVNFANLDVVIHCAGRESSKKLIPRLRENLPRQYQIDASSAFRLCPEWHLSLPEINWNGIKDHPEQRLFAGSNCTTAGLMLVLGPLHKEFGLTNFRVATYQAVSGAGREGLEALTYEEKIKGETFHPKFAPHGIYHNLIPCIDLERLEGEYTGEELKTLQESQKILSSPIASSATAVRIGIPRAHSEAMWFKLIKCPTLEEIKEVWKECHWLDIWDNVKKYDYPTPKVATGKSRVLVGRLRYDTAENDGRHFCCFISFDQLLVGASYNVVNILRKIINPDDELKPIYERVIVK